MRLLPEGAPGSTIVAADVVLLDLPLVEPFAASHGTTDRRTVVAVRVEVDGPDGPVAGWGECSALPAPTYTAESARGCHRLLVDEVVPAVLGASPDGELLARLAHRFGPAPMARSAVEMALVDADLRRRHQSLATRLGAAAVDVPAGVSLGLGDPGAVVAAARSLTADGYRRLKVKIQPGHDQGILDRLRRGPEAVAADVEIHLDANGAYGPDDVERLVALAESGADALEQPLAPGDVEGATRLVERLADHARRSGRRPVPVVADEAVATVAEAQALVERGAVTGLSIKPGRVGGLGNAVELHDRCRGWGLRATAGGMLETGLGRHALVALAALPGFDLTGDLSPAGRWLATDPWPDVTMTDGRITVPTGPGVAPDPDPDLLDRLTIARQRREVTR